MNEKEKEFYLEKFNKDVQWLRDVVPPDDIYDFAEQALMAADFFIHELSHWVDLGEEGERNKVLGLWLRNIVGMRVLRNQKMKGIIDTTLKSKDEI